MRQQIIAGNWKMNKLIGETRELCAALVEAGLGRSGPEVVVCPPYTAFFAARETLTGSGIGLGAQDLFWRSSGAYTGQVSVAMVMDAGCSHAIIGHSESRGRFGVPEEGFTEEVLAFFGENDRTVNLKTRAAIVGGLIPIVCCGELLSERRDGRTDAVVRLQIERGLEGLAAEQVAKIVLAYEPVWAIGTGEVCASEEANRVCGVIRAAVAGQFGPGAAAAVRIQYGGSVKPENAAELLQQEQIDGALVGGASLKAADFAAVVRASPSNPLADVRAAAPSDGLSHPVSPSADRNRSHPGILFMNMRQPNPPGEQQWTFSLARPALATRTGAATSTRRGWRRRICSPTMHVSSRRSR